MIGSRSEGIEREVELVFPAEFETCFGHRVIADLRPGVAFREVGGVGGDFVGNQPLFHILFVGQAEMLFWRDVAQHRAAKPANHCRADTGSEMVVARRDVGGERA
ncbi:hypothetical protein PSEG_05553 [Pseudomonas sp. Nvir]